MGELENDPGRPEDVQPEEDPTESRADAGSLTEVERAAADAARRSAELRARLRSPIGPAIATHPEIVYLDPRGDRPVSQYSPEGEIRMMGEFAAGLSRSKSISRPMAWGLVLVIALPIVISVLAVVLGL